MGRLHTYFKRLDLKYIDKIGREECGRYKWSQMSTAEKYAEVYKVVNDTKEYSRRMKACSFVFGNLLFFYFVFIFTSPI